MQKYNNVRNWLLNAERYEDITRFDKSDAAKEEFYAEMTGRKPDASPTRPKPVKEIKAEVYQRYHSTLEWADTLPEHQKLWVTSMVEIISDLYAIINIQNFNLKHGDI